MMLLDEPMAGMGHEDIDRIVALIRRVSANRTVLMVEHNLNVVEHLSDRITVLTRGRVLAEGDYATVSQNPDVKTAYLGADAWLNRCCKCCRAAILVRRIAHPARRRFRGPRRRGRHSARPQRRRQDDDAEVDHGHGRQAQGLGEI